MIKNNKNGTINIYIKLEIYLHSNYLPFYDRRGKLFLRNWCSIYKRFGDLCRPCYTIMISFRRNSFLISVWDSSRFSPMSMYSPGLYIWAYLILFTSFEYFAGTLHLGFFYVQCTRINSCLNQKRVGVIKSVYYKLITLNNFSYVHWIHYKDCNCYLT